jgi:hypothetical protein
MVPPLRTLIPLTDSNVLGLTTLATHKKVEELVVPSLPVAAHIGLENVGVKFGTQFGPS